jgi:hypothetical protein
MQNEAIEVGKFGLLRNQPTEKLTAHSTAGNGPVHHREGKSEACLTFVGRIGWTLVDIHSLGHCPAHQEGGQMTRYHCLGNID